MAVQALRGFRDYYPEDQAKIVYLRDKIAQICRSFGYEEFEGPAVEPLELYAAKSSDEIVREQAFTFKDRGDEDVTLRPELTPTLARMIAVKQNVLVFPVRWWSWGRFWRYERPQKGRSREFYQWNLDLLGPDSPEADAEILEIVIRFMMSLGVKSSDVVFGLSDRGFVTEFLAQNGVEASQVTNVFKYLDRRSKLTTQEALEYAQKLEISDSAASLAERLINEPELAQKSERLNQVLAILTANGLNEWVQTNLAIVRGFTYYTGIVFECTDRAKDFRAILGGGRYSNLVADVGGQPISGIGMAMGDMVITELLDSLKLPTSAKTYQSIAMIATISDPFVSNVAVRLRDANKPTIVYFGEIGKGLKFASRKNAEIAVIIGPDEVAKQVVSVKNMTSGDQKTIPVDRLIDSLI